MRRSRHPSRAAGGTGRRARLRGVWGNPSGFESRAAHHLEARGPEAGGPGSAGQRAPPLAVAGAGPGQAVEPDANLGPCVAHRPELPAPVHEEPVAVLPLDAPLDVFSTLDDEVVARAKVSHG